MKETSTWIHPKNSGIRIRTVTNATTVNGEHQVFGESYAVVVPAKLTGRGRVRRQFNTKRDAETFASEQYSGTKLLGEAFFELSAEERRDAVSAAGVLRPLGVSLLTAATQFAGAHAKLGGRTSVVEAATYYVRQHPVCLPQRTVDEVLLEMLEAKKQEGLSKRHVNDLETRLTHFAVAFPGQIADITGGQVREWIQGLKVANRTRNNFRLCVQTLCSFAKGREYLPRDWAEMEKVPVWKSTQPEPEIFTPEQMAALLSAASENMIPYLCFGAFAGLRSAEIERLCWSKVDLKKGYITIGADIAKTNSRRLIPIVPNLKSWLAPYAKPRGPVVELANIPNAIQRLVESTRPPGEDEKGKPLPPAVTWRHNGMRHSFCSYRLADVKSAAQVALEAGNSPQMIFRHYRELVDEQTAKTWFSIVPTTAANIVPHPSAATV